MDHHAATEILARAAGWVRACRYRTRQLWKALFQSPSKLQYQQAQAMLSPAEYALFEKMQPSERLHGIQVMNRLMEQEQHNPDLLVAALLHDVGKSKMPLNPWERGMIVLAQAFFPKHERAWGKNPVSQPGWQKPFIVSQHHAAWGAGMAAQAGSSTKTVNLIRRHQEEPAHPLTNEEDILLALLRAADDAY